MVHICNIRLTFLDEPHYINYALVYTFDIVDSMKVGKSYFIGTNILSDMESIPYIKLDSTKGVKYKFLLRKELKKIWKIKAKNVSIKHINNIGNNHNYLVFLNKINKNLTLLKNRINSSNRYAWRSFYEVFSPLSMGDFEKKYIYNYISNDANNKSKIKIRNSNLTMRDIYHTLSKVL